MTLEVEAEIEDILPSSGSSADRPTTTKRKVVTSAIVNNGETIILGGLMKSAGGTSSTKVPILGDIPIIGRLFRSDGDSETQINVVICLTPYIVRKSDDLRKLRTALVQLESIQTQYNLFVSKKLNKKMGYEEEDKDAPSSSRRIKRKVKDNLSILDED